MPALCDRSPETIRRLRSASTSGSTTPSFSFLVAGTDRPAALRDDALILADRLLDIGDRLRAEDRQRWRRPCRPALARASNSSSQLPRRDDFRMSPITSCGAGAAPANASLRRSRSAPERKKRRLVFIGIPDICSCVSRIGRVSARILRSANVNNSPTIQSPVDRLPSAIAGVT